MQILLSLSARLEIEYQKYFGAKAQYPVFLRARMR
jgi:hypothetical protein